MSNINKDEKEKEKEKEKEETKLRSNDQNMNKDEKEKEKEETKLRSNAENKNKEEKEETELRSDAQNMNKDEKEKEKEETKLRSNAQVRTVKVSNVSLSASEKEIKEFFSFSGKIKHVEMQSVNEKSKVAFVTFKKPEGADTAVLLTGATVVDQAVTVTLATDYKLPATASTTDTPDSPHGSGAAQKAEDVVSTMLAKGFILGKGALTRAKSFDDKHKFTSTASARAASLDQKMGLSEKINKGATVVNDKAKEMDEKYKVSDKTKTALAAAEQKVSSASSKLMQNRYVMTGATWVSGAFSTVSKAAAGVQQKTKKKVAEEEKTKPAADKNVQKEVNKDCAQKLEAHHDSRNSSSESPRKAAAPAPASSESPPKPAAAAAAPTPAPASSESHPKAAPASSESPRKAAAPASSESPRKAAAPASFESPRKAEAPAPASSESHPKAAPASSESPRKAAAAVPPAEVPGPKADQTSKP